MEEKLGERDVIVGKVMLSWIGRPLGSERDQEVPWEGGKGTGTARPASCSVSPACSNPCPPRLCRELVAVLGPRVPKSKMDLH